MASENEASCDADPNFAVICGFLEKFGAACGLQAVDFVDLQKMLENTQEVSPVLIDLHIKLMRKIRKSITVERWERGIVKVCHMYSNQDAWEIERFGYKKARLSAKLRLLKELLEMQFDNNTSFKNKINVITAKELRTYPIGRDKLGNAYWYQIDDSCQIRVYKEDPDEETWALVAKDREELVTLISKLSDNQDTSSTDAVTNEDSNSNNEETKTVLDTGQQDSNSSKKSSSDDDKPPELKQEVDDEETKMDAREVLHAKMPELVAPHEEKKPELSGIKEKYIRSDNFVQSNRKAVESAGFVDIGISNVDLKRPLDDDIEEPSLVKRPRTARPTLLGNKKKPYLQQQMVEDELDEEEEVEEEEEFEEDDEEQDEEEEEELGGANGDGEPNVSEAIEEPLMLVMGKGAGKDNNCGNPIVGEVIEEDVLFVYGEGSGRDCDTGNEDKQDGTSEKEAEKKSSITSPTKNCIKLGMILDSKTDGRIKVPTKHTFSRWDVGKPSDPKAESGNSNTNAKKSVSKSGNAGKEEVPVAKAPKFFFGPGSGFSFKTPSPVVKPLVTIGCRTSFTSVTKGNDNSTVKQDKNNLELDNTVKNETAVNTVKILEGEANEIKVVPAGVMLNDEESVAIALTKTVNAGVKAVVSHKMDASLHDEKSEVEKCKPKHSNIVTIDEINEVKLKSNDVEEQLPGVIPIEILKPTSIQTDLGTEGKEPIPGINLPTEDQPTVTQSVSEHNGNPSVNVTVEVTDDVKVIQSVTPKSVPTTCERFLEPIHSGASDTEKIQIASGNIEGRMIEHVKTADLPPTQILPSKQLPLESEKVTGNLEAEEVCIVLKEDNSTTKSDHVPDIEILSESESRNVEANCIDTVIEEAALNNNPATTSMVDSQVKVDEVTNQYAETKEGEGEVISALPLTTSAPANSEKEEVVLPVQDADRQLSEANEMDSAQRSDIDSLESKDSSKLSELEGATSNVISVSSLQVVIPEQHQDTTQEACKEVALSEKQEGAIEVSKEENVTANIIVDKIEVSEESPITNQVLNSNKEESNNAQSGTMEISSDINLITDDKQEDIIKEPAIIPEIGDATSEVCENEANAMKVQEDDKSLIHSATTQVTSFNDASVNKDEVNTIITKEEHSSGPPNTPSAEQLKNEVNEVVSVNIAPIENKVYESTVVESAKDEENSQSIKSDSVCVETPVPPLHSIYKLINEVPKKTKVHDNKAIADLIPTDRCQNDIEQSHTVQLSTIAVIDVVEKPQIASIDEELVTADLISSRESEKKQAEMTASETNQESAELLDLSCTKAVLPLMELPEPALPQLYPAPTHFVDMSSNRLHYQAHSSMTMPILPIEVPDTTYLHKDVHEVPLAPPMRSYHESIEPIEEISMAKSFLMENDSNAAAKISNKQEDSLEEPVIIQEIGSMSSSGFKKQKRMDETEMQEIGSIEKQICSLHEVEEIGKIRANAPTLLEQHVSQAVLSQSSDFIELACVKKRVALLGNEDADHSDGAMYDDGNTSEPMDLEDSKDGQIIERSAVATKKIDDESGVGAQAVIPKEQTVDAQSSKETLVEGVEMVEQTPAEPKKPSLQSFTLDYTGEAPDLSHVHAMVRRSLKRGATEEPPKEKESDEGGGKRRKLRGKRTVDKDLRKSVEDAKNKDVSSSDDDQKQEEAPVVKPEKKPKQKRKRLLLGLEIPEGGVILPTGLRQSRRIAQIKIKEEAERRKLEEIALEEMKNSQKRKNKKTEDKDYKAEKRKHNKIITEDETTNDNEIEEKKKKKKRKHKEFDEKNPWRSSSDSSSEDSHFEEVEEEEEDNYIEALKSDHEFSPESDLENAADPQPLKRARTVRKEDQEQEDDYDDTNCQKCNKSDHPEWILLCDGCDAGWHCSCLRPALLMIPEGDWYCPPCQHNSLIKLLQEKLVEFDKVQSKKEVELRRKQRLAYVGISLANVLPEKVDDASKRVRKQRVKESDDSSSESASASGSQSGSGSSSESSSSSSDSDEPIYKLRQRRQAHSYRFKEYDELIKSATQEDVDEKRESEPPIRGKDMATIVQSEMQEQKEPIAKENESEEDVVKPVRKVLGKKKHRRLNSLEISSEEDEDSDEDFQGSSSDEEEDDYDEYNGSSSTSSIIGRKKGRRGNIRRSTRARINRYDREFINDDSEESDEPRGKRGRSDWEESEESEESDRSWGKKKKRGGLSKSKSSNTNISSTKHKKSKKKGNDDSDPDVYKKKKPKIKFGGLDDDNGGKRRTRGKKINYLDALGTDSEEESRRRNQVKEEESEDEFVLNEEEEDVQDEEGREDGSSDDSNIGGLVPAVKKGSKKGKGKGGIKRIKRAQGEEEEALFPPLPDALPLEPATMGDMETNPIEQINKNLEAMDENEIGKMMEEEEYANRQLQMVAAQLEKEKRRKEMEARKQVMLAQPLAVPVVQEAAVTVAVASVIQTIPSSMAPRLMPQVPSTHLHQLQPEPTQSVHPAMHHQLSPMHHQSPASIPPHHSPQHNVPVQSPQHVLHHQPPAMMVMSETPKKRGRKPKSQLASPETTSAQQQQQLGDKSDDSELGFNADGTPRKRRGRGKGKKTLEKEAAAAAAIVGVHVSPQAQAPAEPSKPPEAKDPVESRPPPVEGKPSAPLDIPMVGGKLGVASAPQPFLQSQLKPSVITRMLQTQPGQPAYPVGGTTHNFGGDRPPEPRPQAHPFAPGAPGIPRAPGHHPGAFRPAANHYPVIRSGAPPIRPPNMPPHIFHHPMENNPPPTSGSGGGAGSGGPPITDRRSPALVSPASVSPLSNKNEPTPPPPPPPPYAVRPPMVRFSAAGAAPPPPRHPQMLPQMHQPRPPYTTSAPPHNYHYPPQYSVGGGGGGGGGGPYHPVPPQYHEQQFAGDPDASKNYEEEENGEFGGLVSYFSSQREDDLDT